MGCSSVYRAMPDKTPARKPSMMGCWTRHEAMKEIAELQLTFPIPPREGAEAVRAKEVGRRLHALWDYVFCEEPAPADDWKPSVPAPTGEERERYILHWAENSGRGLVAGDEEAGR